MVVATANKPAWTRFRGRRDLAETILTDFGVRSAPVDVHAIAEGLGARVIPYEIPMAGILDARDRSAVVIFVNTNDSSARQRFTIAHELGHLLLHPLGVQYRDYITGPYGGELERQANRFGVNLIMPEWLVRPAFRWFNGDLPKLADYFQVSLQAMEIRFRELYG